MRNIYFNVKNLHIALIKDLEACTYEKPVPVPGTTQVSATPQTSSSPEYADGEVWVESNTDNGQDVTITNYDLETDPALRAVYAAITGYALDATGRLIWVADKAPQPFAMLCEEDAEVTAGRRKCWLRCVAEKPGQAAQTNTDSRTVSTTELTVHCRPLTLPTGTVSTGYVSYPGTEGFETFFDLVDTDLVPAPAGGETDGEEG